MNDKIHIVLASDANYLPGLEVTKASIERSCKNPGRIVWHIFGEEDLAKVDVSAFEAWNCGSKMTYLRLFLPELLGDVNWVVYSDVDTVWNRDVCELWDKTLRSTAATSNYNYNSIYWVKDFKSIATHEKYGCAGVCVMNLKKLRKFGLARKSAEYVKAHGTPPFVDQGILNALLKDDCAVLPNVWDVLGDPNNLPPEGEKCVYHITGIGRHFHDKTPPTYPPQYQLWWRVRHRMLGNGNDGMIPLCSRMLAATWPFHGLANLLPLRLRERIVRQWFFAKELVKL